MSYITVSSDVDVDEVIGEIDTDLLIDELERRGFDMNTTYVDGDRVRTLLVDIWQKRRLGKNIDRELDQLIYYALGKVI